MDSLTLYKSPFPKERLGKKNDGGYVIVKLPDTYDLFISAGKLKDITFEEQLLQSSPDITCIAFDGTISELPTPNNRIKLYKKNLGTTSTDGLPDLDKFIELYNNVFLNIDIEGNEYKVMPTLIEKDLMKKIKQLVIQFHSANDIQMFPDYYTGLSHINNNSMFDLFNQINKTHTLVHFHANNGCKIQELNGIKLPHVFELTYIRNDLIINKERNIEKLPTSLDMKTIENNDDYILDGFPYNIN